MVLVHGWKTTQIDLVLAFLQAPIEREIMYMQIPRGCRWSSQRRQVLPTLEASGRQWNQYLAVKLEKIGFKQSKVDACVFYRGNVMYVLYTHDSILVGPDQAETEECIEDMKKISLNLTVQGDLCDFLGINIKKMEDGMIHMSQPHLLDQILEQLRMSGDQVRTKDIPMKQVLSENSTTWRKVHGTCSHISYVRQSDGWLDISRNSLAGTGNKVHAGPNKIRRGNLGL
jgi:hypothetical protein